MKHAIKEGAPVHGSTLVLKHLGIETNHEHVVYMRTDCHVCRSEGFEALTRIQVTHNEKTIVANLNACTNGLLDHGEIGLSNSAEQTLNVSQGDRVEVSHLRPIGSLAHVRSKIYGNELNTQQLSEIMGDVVAGSYSNVHLSAFITACAGNRLNEKEIIALTRSMIDHGNTLKWSAPIVADKHCVGGLPGNRTTPIVVAIAAAAGLTIPKTSSRAITSPAGTADTMETMAPVELSMEKIKKVVNKTGGCIVWGGTASLSPADDILIRVEKALDIDSEGQMIASVLSKKVAAGSTHVVIDIPVGPTAKVRNQEEAQRLKHLFTVVGEAVGLKIDVVITDGTQPIGNGIGPTLEAMDVLSVLKGEPKAPTDLRERAMLIAGHLLELTGKSGKGKGRRAASDLLGSGYALDKFVEICHAQGGFKELTVASFSKEIKADVSGKVVDIDNRRLAKVAKLAGAPSAKKAGVRFYAPIGSKVKRGQTLYTVFAEAKGELEYALTYINSNNGKDIIRIAGK